MQSYVLVVCTCCIHSHLKPSSFPAHKQNIPLKNPNTGQNQEVFININGRVEWTLAKDTGSGSAYPTAVEGAKILSIAVSSLESGGVACTNVGITAITADPGVGRTEVC